MEHDNRADGGDQSELRLSDYFAVLRRRWWVVALCLLLVGGAAYGLSSIQTPLRVRSVADAVVDVVEQERESHA